MTGSRSDPAPVPADAYRRPAMTAIDPYRTLGLTPGASQAEIKRAYRHLAKLYHPDSAGERALAAVPRDPGRLRGPGRRSGPTTGRPGRVGLPPAGAAAAALAGRPVARQGDPRAYRARSRRSTGGGGAGGPAAPAGSAGTAGGAAPDPDPRVAAATRARRRRPDPARRVDPGGAATEGHDRLDELRRSETRSRSPRPGRGRPGTAPAAAPTGRSTPRSTPTPASTVRSTSPGPADRSAGPRPGRAADDGTDRRRTGRGDDGVRDRQRRPASGSAAPPK